MIVICLGLGFASYETAGNALIANAKDTMPKYAVEAGKRLEWQLTAHLGAMDAIASQQALADAVKAPQGKSSAALGMLSQETKRAGHLRMAYVNAKGEAVFDNGDTANLQDKDYFSAAMKGQSDVTSPLLDETGKVVMIYTTPITSDNQPVGVLLAVRDGYELSDIASSITYGDNGQAFIIDDKGRTIAHADKTVVAQILSSKGIGQGDATTGASVQATPPAGESGDKGDKAEAHPSAGNAAEGFTGFEQLQTRMSAGETGFGEYTYNGTAKFMGYAPVAGHGWSLAVEMNKADMLAKLDHMKLLFVWISLAFLAVGLIVAYVIAVNLDRPIAYLTKRSLDMAQGDFSFAVEDKLIRRKDELGELARAFQLTGDSLKGLLGETSGASGQVAASSQELTAAIQHSSVATEEIARVVEISAQSSGEQARSTEHGSKMVYEMGQLIEQEQESMRELDHSVAIVDQMKDEGFAILGELIKKTDASNQATEAMGQVIANTHESVGKIQHASQMIRNIANQTNMLALNASIEAARAGEQGKGFAVVAGETKKLATASALFTEEITAIIEELGSMTEGAVETMQQAGELVASQTESVKLTRRTFKGIAEAIEAMKAVMLEFRAEASALAGKKAEVVSVMEHLSAIAEEYAAGAEQVSASVEEQKAFMDEITESSQRLAQLADQMNRSVDRFTY